MGAPTLRLLLVLQLLSAMENDESGEHELPLPTSDRETFRVVGDDTANVKTWLAQHGRSKEWLAQMRQASVESRVTPRTLGGSHPDKCKICVFHNNPNDVCTKGDECGFCHEQHGPSRLFHVGKKRRSMLVYPEDTWDPTWKPSTPIFIPSVAKRTEKKKKQKPVVVERLNHHQLSEVHAAWEDSRRVRRTLGGQHPHYCKPCAFQNKGTCRKGRDCEFCHEGHIPHHMNANCKDGRRRRRNFYQEDLLRARPDAQPSVGGRIVEVLTLDQLKLEN